MKGIPEKVVLNYCEKNECSVVDVYQRIYDGEKIKFDLTDGATCFKKTNTFDQITLDHFTRTVKLN
jgi:hypothetical protein